MYKKIIVVSQADTCRGPMAEAILRALYAGEAMQVASRGMVVLFPEPVNQKCEAICKAKGYDLSGHRSKPLKDSEFGEDVVVFALSDKQKLQIYNQFHSAVNVFALKDFVGESGDVGNPYGLGLEEYAAFFDRFKDLLIRAKQKLDELEQNHDLGGFI